MKIDHKDLVNVRVADGMKIQVIGSSHIFLRDQKLPSWQRMKVIITKTGENFFLSNSDLKSLKHLSPKFPNYVGVQHTDARDSMKKDGSIVNQTDVD